MNDIVMGIISNKYILMVVMSVVLFFITEGLKRPIKLLTGKAKTARARKLLNLVIMIVPIGLGMLCEYLYNVLFLKQSFDVLGALSYGMSALVLYTPIEVIFFGKNKKKAESENPYDTEEGKSAVNLIKNIAKDGKLDINDIPAIKDFYDKIK